MATRILTIISRERIANVNDPSFVSNATLDPDGVTIVMEGYGASSPLDFAGFTTGRYPVDEASIADILALAMDYGRSYEDATNLLDLIAILTERAVVSDTAISDTLKFSLGSYNVSPAVGVTDVFSTVGTFYLVFSENLVISSDFDKGDYSQSAVNLQDLVSFALETLAQEPLTLSEQLLISMVKALDYQLAVSDTLSKAVVSTIGEPLTVSEAGYINHQDYFLEDYNVISADPYTSLTYRTI